jgi:predicted small metal-binding protein
MKKLKCSDVGGPCDADIKGSTPEEIMMAAGKHLEDTKDDAHQEMLAHVSKITMEDQEGIDWDKDVRAKFAAAPDMTQEEMEEEKNVVLM